MPDCPKEESTSKDKRELKTVTQKLFAESQKDESKSGNKNHDKLKMKKTVCQQSDHEQQEHNFLFKQKVYSRMR